MKKYSEFTGMNFRLPLFAISSGILAMTGMSQVKAQELEVSDFLTDKFASIVEANPKLCEADNPSAALKKSPAASKVIRLLTLPGSKRLFNFFDISSGDIAQAIRDSLDDAINYACEPVDEDPDSDDPQDDDED